MLAMCRVLFVVALGVGFVGTPTARAEDKKPEKPTKSQPAAEPAKTIIIQIDASKLPPDVLKQLLQLTEKPDDKPKPTVTTKPVQPNDKPKPGATEPGKPGTKPGAEPGKPGVKPGTEPGKPGVKPGTEPGKPGVKPGTEPGKPGVKPGTEPGKPGVKPGTEPGKPGVKPGTEPGKPGTKPTGEPTKPTPTSKPGKAISLSDAIAITEKATQGTVVKAMRDDDDGKVMFELEVIEGKGGKTRVTLDAGGNVTKKETKGGKPNK